MFELNLNMYFTLISDFTCKLRKFFANSNFAITAWFFVIISLDRYISIAYPRRFLFKKKLSFQIITCCFIIGFNYCLFIPFWLFYLTENRSNKTNETLVVRKCNKPGMWIEYINIFQQFSIPFCLMLLFTSLTIRTVFNSRKSSTNNSNGIKSKDMRFAVLAIIFNIIFLMLNLPYYLLFLFNDFLNLFHNLTNLFEIFNAFSYFFYYSNSILTFFINYSLNSMFKKEFQQVVVLGRKRSLNSKSKTTIKTQDQSR
jgi:hypothetical protein